MLKSSSFIDLSSLIDSFMSKLILQDQKRELGFFDSTGTSTDEESLLSFSFYE